MRKLYNFELKKRFYNKIFLWTILGFIVVMLGVFFINFYNSPMASSTILSNRDSISYNQKIAKRYEGELSDDKVKVILGDYLNFYKKRQRSGTTDDKPMNVFSYYIGDTMLDSKDNLANLAGKNPNATIEDVDIKPLSDLNINTSIKNIRLTTFFSWADLFKTMNTVFIAIVVVVIIVVSGIFSDEKSQNIEQLLLTTKFGRSKLTREKIKAGFSTAIAVFLLSEIIVLLVYAYFYGFSGWNGSIQANFYLKTFQFPIALNNIQVLALILLIHFMNIIFITSIAMLISAFMDSSFAAMIATFAIIVLPKGLDKIFESGTYLSKVQQYMPINNFNYKNILENMGFNQAFLFNNFWSNFSLVVLLTVLGSLFSVYVIYSHQKDYYIS